MVRGEIDQRQGQGQQGQRGPKVGIFIVFPSCHYALKMLPGTGGRGRQIRISKSLGVIQVARGSAVSLQELPPYPGRNRVSISWGQPPGRGWPTCQTLAGTGLEMEWK